MANIIEKKKLFFGEIFSNSLDLSSGINYLRYYGILSKTSFEMRNSIAINKCIKGKGFPFIFQTSPENGDMMIYIMPIETFYSLWRIYGTVAFGSKIYNFFGG